MAYATYQLAETTIWPILTERSFDLVNIDRYLSTTRGSIPSAPLALLHARRKNQLAVLLVVITVSLLLKADAFLVGIAFKTGMVPTTLYSTQEVRGGLGMAFKQGNPPGDSPGAVTASISNYYAWANAYLDEPMVQQQNYIINRRELAVLGNFTAKAIEMDIKQNCSGWPIAMSGEIFRIHNDVQWNVSTTKYGKVKLRLQPVLTVWVDDIRKTGNASATTRLVFAAINGNIENGHRNIPPPNSEMSKKGYQGISTLACDVNVKLFNSFLCTYPSDDCQSQDSPNVTLSDLGILHSPGLNYTQGQWENAAWLGAVSSRLGVSVAGAQPLFRPGPRIPALDNITLPIPYTSTVAEIGTYPSQNWTLAQLNAFVETGSGALATAMTTVFSVNTTLELESSKPLNRMETWRSYILLFPIALNLAGVLVMLILTEWIHRSCKVRVVRLGTTAEVIDNSQNSDMEAVVKAARDSSDTKGVLSKVKIRYGVLAEGGVGLGQKTNVTALRRSIHSHDFL